MSDTPDGLNESEDTIEINPRSVNDVLRHAVMAISMMRRAGLEEANAPEDETGAFELETERFELYSWVRKECGTVLRDWEWSILQTPVGDLTTDQYGRCMTAALPANVLCWSLGVVDSLGVADEEVFPVEPLLEWAPKPWDELDRLANKLTLRDEETLARERERWEVWYARTEYESNPMPETANDWHDLEDFVREAGNAGLVEIVDSDFTVSGILLAQVPSEKVLRIAALSEQYLLTLNWLCGFGESWDDVPLYPD